LPRRLAVEGAGPSARLVQGQDQAISFPGTKSGKHIHVIGEAAMD
jgi:hypothetical protein